MSLKRKFVQDDDAFSYKSKQMKLVPFPNFEPDDDSVMSEAEPLAHHIRFPSNASTTSTDSTYSASSSPGYPQLMFNQDGTVALDSCDQPPSPNVGLLQPTGNFTHHGSHCAQIPKLRVACQNGLNGRRTMWSFCESCGAISMVEDD